jgi:hypothetical protein
LARGPDRKLHGTREAAELRRIDESTDRKATFGDRMIARLETYDGRGVNIKTVGWCLLPSALVAASILMISFLPDLSPEATVARLTRACLSGHRKKPLLSLEDDAVQRAEFDRWRIRRFASIVDSHRPQGDAVEIEVRPIMATPDAAVFRVTMQSPFFGMRSHTQCWVKRNGVFVFDAVATLEKEDRL